MSSAAQLEELLGADAVSTAPADLHVHAHDHSAAALLRERTASIASRPDCVVRPRDTTQVALLLEWAQATQTPVVPFGGGSGVCEAIRPDGAVVVDMTEMARVIDIDDRSQVVRVQAGIFGPDLDAALAKEGFKLGHEPQSFEISTVGGWIATRASGQLSARYGSIENLVLALEAVLPGGRVVRSKAVPRRAAGPNVASLMIGSEGTLGIVTEAALRIGPRSLERAHMAMSFEHMADGVAACRDLAQGQLDPSLVRLYDPDDVAIFFRNHPAPPTGAVLLTSFEGRGAGRRAEHAGQLGHRLGPEPVDYWWEHRNVAVEDYRRLMAGNGVLGPYAIVDTMEISATWARLRNLYHSTKEALKGTAHIAGCHLSHVYPDGACLYFTMASACESDDDARRTHSLWWETGMRACLDGGGSISHHHGIGRLKAPWLREELGGWWEVLVAVKRAVDPKGVMNPGALGL